MEKTTHSFAARLISRRTALGFSQAELARKAGLSLRSIQNYEGNEASPTGKTLRNLCAALDVPFAWLLNDNPEIALPEKSGEAPVGVTTSQPVQRLDRVIDRLNSLSAIEFARTEPAILALIDAVISARQPFQASSANLTSEARMEALASSLEGKDLEDSARRPGGNAPQLPPSRPSKRNSGTG